MSQTLELLQSLSPQISQTRRESIRNRLGSAKHDTVVIIDGHRFELHKDVFCYWSLFAQGLIRFQPNRSLIDEPIVLESAEVNRTLFRNFVDYFYGAQLLVDPQNLACLWSTADFLDIPPARSLIASRQPKGRRHFTRIPVPDSRKTATLDLHTVRYEDGDDLYLTIEGCEFHQDHLRRDNGTFFLETIQAKFENRTCYFRIGPIMYSEDSTMLNNQLLEDTFIRNLTHLVKQGQRLESLSIIGVPPQDSIVHRLKHVLQDVRRGRKRVQLSVNFYEPSWGSMGEDINIELRTDDSTERIAEESRYRNFQKAMASAFR